jgi:ABC-type Fe3+-siderophore transport system permease subunit
MNNENMLNMLKQFVHSYVYAPFLGSSFVLGLLLLFYRDFESGSTLRIFLVPAIVVYTIGTLLIGYFYFELDVINCVRAKNKGENANPQPAKIIMLFRFLHVIWLLLLIIYLFWKIML